MTEPMKCANGCGDYVWEVSPRNIHHITLEPLTKRWVTGAITCRMYSSDHVATLPTLAVETPTGIKSEDIRPVEGVTLNDLRAALGMKNVV